MPVNFGNLRNPKRDMLWVAAAGPAANFVMAIGWALLMKDSAPGALLDSEGLSAMALAGVKVNVMLMALNLIPILPLDGGRIVVSLLPRTLANSLCAARALRLLHRDGPPALDRRSASSTRSCVR